MPYQQSVLSPVTFHMSLLSGIFVLLNELRDGPNQNQSYLTMTLLYVYLLEFLFFNVWRYSEEKIRMIEDFWVAFSLFPFMIINCLSNRRLDKLFVLERTFQYMIFK